jgi:hypothetical protein
VLPVRNVKIPANHQSNNKNDGLMIYSKVLGNINAEEANAGRKRGREAD